MYRIGFDDAGNIVSYTGNKGYILPGCNSAEVPEEYTYLFNLVNQGKLRLSEIKVDIESKKLKLINLLDTQKNIDVTLGKFIEIYFNKEECDLNITFKTIDSKPHIVVESTYNEDREFKIYLTRKMNINYLYQTICCETNKATTVEIDQLDYRDIFSNNFSLYYQKQFNTAGYRIVWKQKI